NGSRIIVYYGKDLVTQTTRVIFTLDYAGLGDHVSLLDGGMEAWKREGNQTTNVAPPATQASNHAPPSTRPIRVEAKYVKAHIARPGVSIVDGRATAFYEGVQTGSGHRGPHKTGHIASAKSVPFTEITDDKVFVKPLDQLASIFAKAGVAPTDTVVGY